MQALEQVISLDRYPLNRSTDFVTECRQQIEQTGVLVLPSFLTTAALKAVKRESLQKQHLAYFCEQTHSAYLTEPDPELDGNHPKNRQVISSKGAITDDQVNPDSVLRVLYKAESFQQFLCEVLGDAALFEYADPLSSINIHIYRQGQQLGWHFDNSSFAVTLLIQSSRAGGEFEYITSLRDTVANDQNYAGVAEVLEQRRSGETLKITEGSLVLFRGRESLHRVTPVIGDTTRILVVLAYNVEPGIALSESARLTFYGRLD